MLKAVLDEPRSFRIAEDRTPAPGPGEVLLRILSVGICGSDLHLFRTGEIGGIGSPVNLQLIEFVIHLYPAGCIGYPVMRRLASGLDAAQTFRLECPVHQVCDMAPEILKNSA